MRPFLRNCVNLVGRDPVIAAAPLPELKPLHYVRQHTSDSLKEVDGETFCVWNCVNLVGTYPVTAAAPLPELKLLNYVRQHTSDSLP